MNLVSRHSILSLRGSCYKSTTSPANVAQMRIVPPNLNPKDKQCPFTHPSPIEGSDIMNLILETYLDMLKLR
jgi:hypothetical protein